MAEQERLDAHLRTAHLSTIAPSGLRELADFIVRRNSMMAIADEALPAETSARSACWSSAAWPIRAKKRGR